MLKGVHLTLLIGPLVPLPAPRAVVDALESAQATISATEKSGFQLVFRYSSRSLIATALLPAGYFDPNIRVVLVATVNGIPTVLCDGLITRQEAAPSNAPGQSTLTITGEDLTVAMDTTDKTGVVSYPDNGDGVGLTVYNDKQPVVRSQGDGCRVARRRQGCC